MRRKNDSSLVQMVLVAGLLLCAACTSDSKEPPSSSASSASDKPAPKEETPPVKEPVPLQMSAADAGETTVKSDPSTPEPADSKPADSKPTEEPTEEPASPTEEPAPLTQISGESRFIGAKKCKKCHSSAAHGAQYKKWAKMRHSKAFTVLGEADAKAVGAKNGAPDPQTSPKCLKCHETGYGQPASKFAKSFKPQLGVQCESCHGPGEKHAKARSEAEKTRTDDSAPLKVPAGEILMPKAKTCTLCHNKKSPSFKAFDYKERCKKIAHPDPTKHRPPCE